MNGDDKIEAIRAHIAAGWALTPLHWIEDGKCSCGNPHGDPDHDYRQGGKHPLSNRWQLRPISTERDAIRYWTQNPQANVGGLTGTPSGMWVLDFDPDNGAKLSDLPRALNAAAINRTGSGGMHFIYRTADDFCPNNARGDLPKGWDVRGTGGQVVLPPSVSNKGPYSVIKAGRPTRAPKVIEEVIGACARKSSGKDAPDCASQCPGFDLCGVRDICIAWRRSQGPSVRRVGMSQ